MKIYRESILTFFDILGFSGLIKNRHPQAILDDLNELKYLSDMPPDIAEMHEFLLTQFSDCIVRSVPLDSENNTRYPIGLVFHEILSLVHVQSNMILRGIVLRGSITVGKIYHTKENIFGPALVRGYKLESKIAFYPRIIIDPDLLRALDHDQRLLTDGNSPNDEKYAIRELLFLDSDGIWFVDYIRAMQRECENKGIFIDFIQRHREQLLFLIDNKRETDKVTLKLSWLVNYHNHTVKKIFENGLGGLNDLLVPYYPVQAL